MRDHKWRVANRILFAVIILINGYIILSPILPNVSFWWQKNHSTRTADLSLKLQSPVAASSTTNVLIIPKMMLETPIVEGPMSRGQANLELGAWRLPIGSNPTKGSNTVIAGHRFSYTGPHGIFYYLDKLEPGDEIGLRWKGVMHHYKVVSSKVVSANTVSVQEPTNDEQLTLYTCTPLWNPVNRVVVVAKPSQESTP